MNSRCSYTSLTSTTYFLFIYFFLVNCGLETGQKDALPSSGWLLLQSGLEMERLMGLHLARLDPECQMWLLIGSHLLKPRDGEGLGAPGRAPRECNNRLSDIWPPCFFPCECLFRNRKDEGKIRGESLG